MEKKGREGHAIGVIRGILENKEGAFGILSVRRKTQGEWLWVETLLIRWLRNRRAVIVVRLWDNMFVLEKVVEYWIEQYSM